MMDMVAIDFFTVPTATFRILFVLVVFRHARRQVVHSNVTANPTARWTAQQIVEAFPWDTAPKYLLRDRDGIYGAYFRQRLKNMDITEVIIAPRSPWQNPFVERLIGSIRRDCLDHVIVLNESHLSRILSSYFQYYHHDRTHYSLGKDTPVERSVQPRPAKGAKVIELPRVGGLHHRYEWKEAA
jgi:transposase InsO family protein